MLLTLNTNYQQGSYEDDRNQLVKINENRNLANPALSQSSRLAHLRPHFDGKDSIAVGYGLDLLNNTIGASSNPAAGTINYFLQSAGLGPLSQHDTNLISQAQSNRSQANLQALASQFQLNLIDEPTAERVLARIIHEHFCCNRRFAAATSLRRAGSPLAPSTYCTSTPRDLTASRARLATRLSDFATNCHE